MNTILPVALISFQDGLRHRVLYGVMVFALSLIVFAVLFSGFFMRDILKIILDLCLSAVSLGGLLVPFFLSISLLSGDIEQKTIYTLLARPISRSQYILGKFLGIGMLSGLIVFVLTCSTLLAVWGATFLYQGHFFSSFSIQSVLIASGMSYFAIMVLNSTVVLWCSMTTSSFLATLLTLATYVIGQTVEDIVHFISLQIPGVDISPAVKIIVSTALYIFPNLAAFDFKKEAAHGLGISFADLGIITLYGLAYITVMLVLAILFFRKRDLS